MPPPLLKEQYYWNDKFVASAEGRLFSAFWPGVLRHNLAESGVSMVVEEALSRERANYA